MRILMVHNYYRLRGGEDESTEQDVSLLKANGHEVRMYSRNNNAISDFSLLQRSRLFFSPVWSLRTCRDVAQVMESFKPAVVHVQNFFPLVSPSVFYVARRHGAAVVHTLRNYRLMCPSGILFRKGGICETCLARSPWPGVAGRCYRDSVGQTASVALMLSVHRILRTWRNQVSLFITLTEFARNQFVRGGFVTDRIEVRPNFLATDPGESNAKRVGALFAGRLCEEKGVMFLLDAWQRLPNVPLTVIGDGPLRDQVEHFVAERGMRHVQVRGELPHAEVLDALRKASFLVMPSLWYETFGRLIIEAYAVGTPVIASRLGAMQELVEECRTGLLFDAGSPERLVDAVNRAMKDDRERLAWGRNARVAFERRYSAHVAHARLMQIYERAIRIRDG